MAIIGVTSSSAVNDNFTDASLRLIMNGSGSSIFPNSEKNSLYATGLLDDEHYVMPKRDALYIIVPLTILYAVLMVTGLLGNIITCLVIARNKHMRTATNYYLFSLAISDLLLLITGLPQEMYLIWSKYPYIFGETFCLLRGLAAETSTNASVLTITAFTVERYLAICHPFLVHTKSTTSRSIKIIFIIWLVAFTFAMPQALQLGIVTDNDPELKLCTLKTVIIEYSFELSTLLFFVVPMIVISVMYSFIGIKLKHSSKLNRRCSSIRNESNDTSSVTSNNKQRRCKKIPPSQRVLKMLAAVVVAFFICWAPFHAQRLVAIYAMDSPGHTGSTLFIKLYGVVTYISAILYYVSATINPILYHTMSRKFRNAFKETLSKMCCCGPSKRSKPYLMVKNCSNRSGKGEEVQLNLLPFESSASNNSKTESSQNRSTYLKFIATSTHGQNGRPVESDSYVFDNNNETVVIGSTVNSILVNAVGSDSTVSNNIDSRCRNQIETIRILRYIRNLSCIRSSRFRRRNHSPTYYKRQNLIKMHLNDRSNSNMDSNVVSNSSLKSVDTSAIQEEMFAYNSTRCPDTV